MLPLLTFATTTLDSAHMDKRGRPRSFFVLAANQPVMMARDPVTAEELGTGPVTATRPPPATAAAAGGTPGSATADPPPAIAAAAVVTPGPATAGPGAVFTPLTGARVQLLTGGVTVPPNPSQPEDRKSTRLNSSHRL